MYFDILTKKTGKKIKEIFLASSSEVYQNAPFYPTDEKVRLIIPDPNNPRFSYSSTKIISEILLLNSDFFKKAVIFRPHNIYGPRMGMSHVIPELLKKTHFIKNNKLNLFSPNHTRTFCFIDDAIKIIFKLVTNKKTLNKTIFALYLQTNSYRYLYDWGTFGSYVT